MRKKTCSGPCGLEKTINEFHKDRSRKDDHSYLCKNCEYEKRMKYYYNNREKEIKNQTEYQLKRIKVDIQFKLTKRLRQRLGHAIKKESKSGSAVADLGCSIAFFKRYLESMFQPGMTWDNWSFTGWHIDHIKPLSSFDLTDREQLLEAVHYTNLQPLWAQDNLTKSSKLLQNSS